MPSLRATQAIADSAHLVHWSADDHDPHRLVGGTGRVAERQLTYRRSRWATGCEGLAFDPSISVLPDTSTAGSPSGLSVDLSTPQNESPTGLAEGNLKKAVVTLPAGMVVNPATANGLGHARRGDRIGQRQPSVVPGLGEGRDG